MLAAVIVYHGPVPAVVRKMISNYFFHDHRMHWTYITVIPTSSIRKRILRYEWRPWAVRIMTEGDMKNKSNLIQTMPSTYINNTNTAAYILLC